MLCSQIIGRTYHQSLYILVNEQLTKHIEQLHDKGNILIHRAMMNAKFEDMP